MSSEENKWSQPSAPPPPLFVGEKERNLVKQVHDELIERVVGQQVVYYPIDVNTTDFHPVYGEAIKKTFLPPVRIYCLVQFEGLQTNMDRFGVDKNVNINVYFHKRRLVEDQNLFAREGDFLLYGDIHYEIVSLQETKQLFGQIDYRYEIMAKCIRAREGLFDAT